MTNSNTTTVADLVKALPREGKLKGYTLGRCHTCNDAYQFRGRGITLEIAGCPVCGAGLAQTTGALKRGFRVIDGRDQAGAIIVDRMLANGLADAIAWRRRRADQAARSHNAAVGKVLRREEGVHVSTFSRLAGEEYDSWVIGNSVLGPDRAGAVRDSIERDLAAADKFVRKAGKLGIEVEAYEAPDVMDVPPLPDTIERLELNVAHARQELDRHRAYQAERPSGLWERAIERDEEALAKLEDELAEARAAAGEVDQAPRPVHFQTGSSRVRCGAPMRDREHPDGWDLGNITVDLGAATCERCRRVALPSELAEFRGPDGDLGTDGPYIERILDARDAEAEAATSDEADELRALADKREAEGNPRVAELIRRAAAGDRVAWRAAKAYRTDEDLVAAEELSRAQDLTDGGTYVDVDGRPV